jgi:murein DD-endopeptidase MepM/ murein hydrolase activator NlpD
MRIAKTRRHRGLVLKVMAGGRGISLRITPTFLVLVAVLLGLGGWQASVWLDRGASRYQAQIQELEKANSQYRAALALKEREKEQMLALAEDRFEQLRSRLQSQDQELAQIGRVVGSAGTTRRTLKGSRSGRHSNSLRLKMNYRKLMAAVEGRESDLNRLRAAALDYRKRVQRQREAAALNATPSLWPCRGSLSSGFGWRIHPVYGYGRMHTGVDISAPSGTPIVATAAGRVIQSGWLSGYGYAITVDHGNGLSTLYAHCSSLAQGVGAFVRKGQTIAYVGSTGVSTGPHVHYEVLASERQVDPAPYLVQKEPPASMANHSRQGG